MPKKWKQRPRGKRYRCWRLQDGVVVDQDGVVVSRDTLVLRRTDRQVWMRFRYQDRVWSGYTLPRESWLFCQETWLPRLDQPPRQESEQEPYRCRRCGKTRCRQPLCWECRRAKTTPCRACGKPRRRQNKSGLCQDCWRHHKKDYLDEQRA